MENRVTLLTDMHAIYLYLMRALRFGQAQISI
jgi:hypothetical protein